MNKIIAHTIGLRSQRNGRNVLVKVEYVRQADGSVKLFPISGNTLSRMPGKCPVITAAQFEDRPRDSYNSTREAIWALSMCGWQA